LVTLAAPVTAWKRLGSGAQASGPSLICLYGAGEAGKTRFAASAPRACPKWFGRRAVYLAIDPEAASLGPVLEADRQNLEVVTLDYGRDLFDQLLSIYGYNWRAEGLTTVITDTMTVGAQNMLQQVTDSGRFSDKHIDLGSGAKQPMPGDFGATITMLMSLLRKQVQSGMNHITIFHELEQRPEPGKPGDVIGGPGSVGKASIRTVVNWYNSVWRLTQEAKRRTDLTRPQEYQRVLHTTTKGYWQGKLRHSTPTNPIPELVLDPDPISTWQKLEAATQHQETL
jgi:hypothetical protein